MSDRHRSDLELQRWAALLTCLALLVIVVVVALLRPESAPVVGIVIGPIIGIISLVLVRGKGLGDDRHANRNHDRRGDAGRTGSHPGHPDGGAPVDSRRHLDRHRGDGGRRVLRGRARAHLAF